MPCNEILHKPWTGIPPNSCLQFSITFQTIADVIRTCLGPRAMLKVVHHIISHHYRKVMFLHLSVILFTGWGCAIHLGRHPPAQCMLGYCQQAGGTHPTGMHSCSAYFHRKLHDLLKYQKKERKQASRKIGPRGGRVQDFSVDPPLNWSC